MAAKANKPRNAKQCVSHLFAFKVKVMFLGTVVTHWDVCLFMSCELTPCLVLLHYLLTCFTNVSEIPSHSEKTMVPGSE